MASTLFLESFTRKQEYGLTLLMSTDKKVSKFISDILAQVKDWLEKKQVRCGDSCDNP